MDIYAVIAQLSTPCPPAHLAALFSRWRQESAPATEALVAAAALHFKIPADDTMLVAARAAARLADTPHAGTYHNSHHFREVVACAIRLIAADGTLAPREAATLLCAAAAHDLGHDGTQNGAAAYRLEDIAFAQLLPLLESAGIGTDEKIRLHRMIRATDLAHDQAALAALADDPRGAYLACLLADADITPSTGTTPAFCAQLTRLFAQETGADGETSVLAGFARFVAARGFLSDAGRRLNAAPLAALLRHIAKNPAPRP